MLWLDRHTAANYFLRRVAEHALRRSVPTDHSAGSVKGGNRQGSTFH